jgi:DNA-binding CsgD family transcriptional regulator
VSGVAKQPRESDGSIAVAVVIVATALRSKVHKALLAIEDRIVIVDDVANANVTISDRMLDADAPTIFIGQRRNIDGALQEGFVGGLLASFSDTQLRIAVEAAMHGLVCAPVASAGSGYAPPFAKREDEGLSDLTARETDVLGLLMTGASNKQIARQLLISVHTVKFHVASIIAKLGASSRTDAVARAIMLGQVMI